MNTHFMKFQSRILALAALLLCTAKAAADIPEGYYSRANGLKKEALKLAMKDIVGKAKVLSYGSGEGSTWWGFYVTDRMEDGQVIDRYCDTKRYFTGKRGDKVAGMNIEHSFPKSWWGGNTNQAYKDLYNLMPCDINTNSNKSNYVIGKVTSKATYDNGCTKIGECEDGFKVWEPADKWKGDFARNYFYMVTAYSNLSWTSEGTKMLQNGDWPTLKPWAYKLLLQWNRQDPVDETEKKRNEAVYGIQGNRNPFIDYPNLAEYIWGDSIAYSFHIDGTSQGGDENPPVIPDEPDEPATEFTISAVDFRSEQGDWTVKDVELSGLTSIWKRDGQYGMVASAYVNDTKYNTESWLISPEYDLTGAKTATFTFSHTGKFFGTMSEEATLWVSTDGGSHWEQMTIGKYMTGSNWTYVTSTQDLTRLCGKKVRLGFRYTSSTEACGTWEISTIKLTGTKTTGVEEIIADEDGWNKATYTYDLSGRRVPDTQRGLIIRNGKKILHR